MKEHNDQRFGLIILSINSAGRNVISHGQMGGRVESGMIMAPVCLASTVLRGSSTAAAASASCLDHAADKNYCFHFDRMARLTSFTSRSLEC